MCPTDADWPHDAPVLRLPRGGGLEVREPAAEGGKVPRPKLRGPRQQGEKEGGRQGHAVKKGAPSQTVHCLQTVCKDPDICC